MEMTDVYWLLISYYLNLAASEEWIHERLTGMGVGPGKAKEGKEHLGGGRGGGGENALRGYRGQIEIKSQEHLCLYCPVLRVNPG